MNKMPLTPLQKEWKEREKKQKQKRREEEKKIKENGHKMNKWHTEIRCPLATERFYSVRECKLCGLEEMEHAAGHFIDDGLFQPCRKENKGE